jgi:hypothetical protein
VVRPAAPRARRPLPRRGERRDRAGASRWPNAGTPVNVADDGTIQTRNVATDAFPYAVGYEVNNDTLTVLAVFHQHRRPRYWADRHPDTTPDTCWGHRHPVTAASAQDPSSTRLTRERASRHAPEADRSRRPRGRDRKTSTGVATAHEDVTDHRPRNHPDYRMLRAASLVLPRPAQIASVRAQIERDGTGVALCLVTAPSAPIRSAASEPRRSPRDQIGQQVDDDDVVLSVAEHQPDGHLGAVSGDDQGDHEHLVATMNPSIINTAVSSSGQVAGRKLTQAPLRWQR